MRSRVKHSPGQDSIPVAPGRMPVSAGLLQTPRRLAPPIVENDIRQRNTANWTELAHLVAERQYRIRMGVRRQTESGLRFLLELQVQRHQSRTKAEEGEGSTTSAGSAAPYGSAGLSSPTAVDRAADGGEDQRGRPAEHQRTAGVRQTRRLAAILAADVLDVRGPTSLLAQSRNMGLVTCCPSTRRGSRILDPAPSLRSIAWPATMSRC